MKIVTHNGPFHQDDLFAVATILEIHPEAQVVRSRDPQVFADADFVVDVGREDDPNRNRFDHHQPGGAGVRGNGVPYASFGLVWKKFGEKLCGGDARVADVVDKKMVQPIDAADSGFNIYQKSMPGLSPYLFDNVITALSPTWRDGETNDQAFAGLMPLARLILRKEIEKAVFFFEDIEVVKKVYRDSADKRIIVFDRPYAWRSTLTLRKEPLFVIFPDTENGGWSISGVPTHPRESRLRVYFPRSWAGLRGEDLERASGIKGAEFVHNKLFVGKAKTLEAAKEMAERAIR